MKRDGKMNKEKNELILKDDIEEDDVEIEEEVTYVEQEEIEVGYTEDEEEKSSDSEDEDEFDASFGDGEEESFGSYNDQSEDY